MAAGIWSSPQASKSSLMGARVRIVQLRAGARMRERLSGMGLAVAGEISVLQRQGGGAVLIETGGKRYALCCRMAQAIRVTGGRP